MTREEAIAIIRKEYLCVDRDCDIERSCGKCDLMMPTKEPILEAYNMAIKALEQEPKTGHWIMPVQDDGMSEPICYQVRCSECDFDLDPQTWHMELHQYGADKYCPNCGCYMVEPQKSEEVNG